MRKLNVLLLGWDFPPVTNGELGEACYGISKALANRVNLALILPKSDPEFILKNVDLTGLNNVDLKAIKPPKVEQPVSAFSEVSYTRQEIVPYGAPVLTGQEKIEARPITQPGEGESVGFFGEHTDIKPIAELVEELNIWGQTDLSLIDRNSQVINYARYASRLAARKEYEVIYAYDWRAFLAGIELKLVSGKPLVLHVHSLSFERGGPDCKAWIYELEKQALEKCDGILAVSSSIVTQLIEDYNIKPDKIKFVEETTFGGLLPSASTGGSPAEDISDEIYNMEISESNNALVQELLPLAGTPEKNWEAEADVVWHVLQGVTEPVEHK